MCLNTNLYIKLLLKIHFKCIRHRITRIKMSYKYTTEYRFRGSCFILYVPTLKINYKLILFLDY